MKVCEILISSEFTLQVKYLIPLFSKDKLLKGSDKQFKTQLNTTYSFIIKLFSTQCFSKSMCSFSNLYVASQDLNVNGIILVSSILSNNKDVAYLIFAIYVKSSLYY